MSTSKSLHRLKESPYLQACSEDTKRAVTDCIETLENSAIPTQSQEVLMSSALTQFEFIAKLPRLMPGLPIKYEEMIRKDAIEWKGSITRSEKLDDIALAKAVENATERMGTCAQVVRVFDVEGKPDLSQFASLVIKLERLGLKLE